MIKGKGDSPLSTGMKIRNNLRRSVYYGTLDASIESICTNYFFGTDVWRVWDGTQWKIARLERYNGSGWVDSLLKRWDGNNWVVVTIQKNI